MNRIPCKKCPQCGLYNDFTIVECECGKKLNSIEAKFVDADEFSPEEYGEIDTSLKVYVQKCSACGALNYTDNPSNPVKMCYNCHKTRVSSIVPSEYSEEDSEDTQRSSATEVVATNSKNGFGAKQTIGQIMQEQPSYGTDDDDDDNDDNDEVVRWQDTLENVKKKVATLLTAKTNPPCTQQVVESKVAQVPNNFDDDDDDDEDSDWSGSFETKTNSMQDPKQRAPLISAKKDITLTAMRYERLTFTIDAGQDTYMLGRSANQGAFLAQDDRVGNEHCCLFFRNGTWFVKDNHSKNGTAVNSRDIGFNGECMLSDGDELKLGHHPNSVAFRISIK